jgi:hypothetical protein
MTKYTLVLASSFALAACGDDLIPPPGSGDTGPAAVIASGNFQMGQPGVLSRLSLETLAMHRRIAPTGAIGDDPMMRKIGNELFVVNRNDGNNVTILDAATFEVKEQLATGAGSNPQDVAVVGDKLYVPGFETKGVVVLQRGTTTQKTIDLSALDPDGKPNCNSAYAIDHDVYVTCELLDDKFKPRGPGAVVVIDAATDAVRTMLTLHNGNPFGTLERVNLPDAMPSVAPDLVIQTVPDIIGDPLGGCVERITPGPTPVAGGCFIQNKDIKGTVVRLNTQQIGSLAVLWLVVTSFDAQFNTHGNLQAFDMVTKCLWSAPVTPETQTIVDAASCPDGTIVLADQSMAANGLRIYEGNLEKTMGPVPTGLKPGLTRGLECY